MNIFVLDEDPELCARYHADKHVRKMILESAQMLCTAHRVIDGDEAAEANIPGCLRATHRNHPCARWVRESIENYSWLHVLLSELLIQFEERFGKLHKYETLCSSLWLHWPKMDWIHRTPFVQAMPDEYKNPDPVVAYRAYYRGAKRHIAQWSVVGQPEWWS